LYCSNALRASYEAPVALLTPCERRVVERLSAEVKPILNRIEARQHDPHADALASWMEHHADPFSARIYDRVHRDDAPPGSPGDAQDDFSLMPFFPDKPPINGMIDPSLSMADFQALTRKLPADAEVLRPTTVITCEGDGTLDAIPLPRHPAFRADHLALADALERVADTRVREERLDPRIHT
jgi:hypothetical protein